jgi:uncharacterized protein (UPF0332 family)
MDDRRLSEAKINYDSYLSQELLKKVKYDKNIFDKFEENAKESLIVAEYLFNNKISPLWTIVSSYYSMFYIASAYIYKKGYKTQHMIVHKVINDTLIVLSRNELENKYLEEYEDEKNKALSIAENILDNYDLEKTKRSRFQYDMTSEIKEKKALTSLTRAKEFVNVFRELIYKD